MPRSFEDYQAHIKNRIVHPPSTLYKYVTASTANKILTTNKVQWGSPKIFNDPFDGQWDIFAPLYTKEALEYNAKRMRDLLLCKVDLRTLSDPKAREAVWADRKKLLDLPRDERESRVEEIVRKASANSLALRSAAMNPLDGIVRRGRVFCACEEPLQEPMWAHYADNGDGAVLSFSSAVLEDGWQTPFEQVRYVDTFPELVDPQAFSDYELGFGPLPYWRHERDWLLYKKSSWSYEKEWRIVATSPGGTKADRQFVTMPSMAITRIIFGRRTTEENVRSIRAHATRLFPQIRFTRVAIGPDRRTLCEVDVV